LGVRGKELSSVDEGEDAMISRLVVGAFAGVLIQVSEDELSCCFDGES